MPAYTCLFCVQLCIFIHSHLSAPGTFLISLGLSQTLMRQRHRQHFSIAKISTPCGGAAGKAKAGSTAAAWRIAVASGGDNMAAASAHRRCRWLAASPSMAQLNNHQRSWRGGAGGGSVK
jgi:hypothetical protein